MNWIIYKFELVDKKTITRNIQIEWRKFDNMYCINIEESYFNEIQLIKYIFNINDVNIKK